ncbi:hypothetical protein RN001_002450 [Aquatica leii]|uniref:Uncharacterized protein n=1 Tax=Aquatica leii TaxID=1421715 RepID=A0AAN7PGY8_9COLE|nr:hypothetical protein RN001_002450 [Aquatica leii]
MFYDFANDSAIEFELVMMSQSQFDFNKSSALYYVVEFPDEENNGITPLSVVSYKWLGGANQCFWPGRAKADKERMKMFHMREL